MRTLNSNLKIAGSIDLSIWVSWFLQIKWNWKNNKKSNVYKINLLNQFINCFNLKKLKIYSYNYKTYNNK